MTLDESKTNEDILDQEFGVSLIADKKLSEHLEGATVDYIESPQGGGFQIRTSRPKSSCGDSCGGSCS